ncbi:hypothetical protein VTI74DRAFT_2695 [Chaetomium olivicolor]
MRKIFTKLVDLAIFNYKAPRIDPDRGIFGAHDSETRQVRPRGSLIEVLHASSANIHRPDSGFPGVTEETDERDTRPRAQTGIQDPEPRGRRIA